MWVAHTASGYYIENAWEHYRCHQVYISSSKHERISRTVFFRHKYLTMPTITPTDALIKAADNLVDVILGRLPKNSVCHRPSGPKPEIQHNRRGRGMLTLTWEELTISEGERSCCSCSKKEIMSFGFYLKVIYKSACKESCILQCQQCQKVELAHCQRQKESISCTRLLHTRLTLDGKYL